MKNEEKNILYIEKPFLVKKGEIYRLCAKIKINDKEDMLYFEVEEKWGKYLVTEYSDPFILAVLERAMKNKWNIKFEQPMSEDLYYGLTTYTIPIYAKNIKIFNEINLIGDTTNFLVNSENAVGTGFSAGVDSFYTVLKHLSNEVPSSKKLTHLVLTLNGAASTGKTKELDEFWFENSIKRLKPYAKEMNLELIGIKGNIDLFYKDDKCFRGDTIVTGSFIHALRKLFSTYYWASAYPAEIFGFPDLEDAGFWENIAVSYVSVEGLRFYHSGSETTRIGKVKYISSNSIAQKGLIVCGRADAKNCGRCEKCLRTMSELNAIGKLNLFNKTFPVNDYKKNYTSRLADEFAIDHPPFTTDIKKEMRSNGKNISIVIYIKYICYYVPFYFLKNYLKDIKWLRRIYYKLNIGGQRTTKEEQEAKLKALDKE